MQVTVESAFNHDSVALKQHVLSSLTAHISLGLAITLLQFSDVVAILLVSQFGIIDWLADLGLNL